MLIQHIVGAIVAKLVARAFGFGAAEARAIGVGLFGRLYLLAALLESFQVDHVPHARPHHPAARVRDNLLRLRAWSRRARANSQANSMVIQNPRLVLSVCIKKRISLLYNQIILAPYIR